MTTIAQLKKQADHLYTELESIIENQNDNPIDNEIELRSFEQGQVAIIKDMLDSLLIEEVSTNQLNYFKKELDQIAVIVARYNESDEPEEESKRAYTYTTTFTVEGCVDQETAYQHLMDSLAEIESGMHSGITHVRTELESDNE